MRITGTDMQPPRKSPLDLVRSSLAAKFTLAMAFVAVAPLLLTGFVINRFTSSNLSAQAGSSTAEVAARTADLVAQVISENLNLLEVLATNAEIRAQLDAANKSYRAPQQEIKPQLMNLDRQWIQEPDDSPMIQRITSDNPAVNPSARQLRNFKGRFPQHAEVFVTDRYGAVVAATNRTSNYYYGNGDWWQQAWNQGDGSVYIGKPAFSKSVGAAAISMAVPVRSAANEVLGILRSTLNAKQIVDLLASVKGGQTIRAIVVDPDGQVLFDPSGGLEGKQLPAGLLRLGVLKSNAGWVEDSSLRGVSAIVGYAKPSLKTGIPALDQLQWTALVSIESQEALASIGAATRSQIIMGLVGILLAVLAGALLARRLTSQTKHIMELFGRIEAGDYKARAPVVSSDELGQMTEGLNRMLDNTLNLIQSKEERDALQASIVKLLDEVGNVASGDLTCEAEVTSDVTGAIADAFNYMIAELRRIISKVQDVTVQVSTVANQTQVTTQQLAKGSDEQAAQIINTYSAINQMAVSIQQVSENAKRCAAVAQQSLLNAKQGAQSVQDTIRGMARIRDRVQETAKRIKRLGETSQEIGEIVQLIEDIADRTSILALNASIQASMAGEAGTGFAVVAEEIERLAERSAEATKRIANLVKAIQTGTVEAIAAMEESTKEVVEGSKLANQAGQALVEIEAVSNQLAELIESISRAAVQQAQGSEAISKSMAEIAQITQRTASGIKQSAFTVNNLAVLADELRASVASFKLPSNNGQYSGRVN
jgi:methyl-accepting chemotaxis protein